MWVHCYTHYCLFLQFPCPARCWYNCPPCLSLLEHLQKSLALWVVISEFWSAVVPAKAWKLSQVSPEILLRLRQAPEHKSPRSSSGIKDTSANSALLHISSVQIENKADYYCLIGYNSVLYFDTGNGEVGKILVCSGLWTLTFPKF
jgi:hypothetical protein